LSILNLSASLKQTIDDIKDYVKGANTDAQSTLDNVYGKNFTADELFRWLNKNNRHVPLGTLRNRLTKLNHEGIIKVEGKGGKTNKANIYSLLDTEIGEVLLMDAKELAEAYTPEKHQQWCENGGVNISYDTVMDISFTEPHSEEKPMDGEDATNNLTTTPDIYEGLFGPD